MIRHKDYKYAALSKSQYTCSLCSLSALKEGDHAHLECRVEPINDPNMRIEWFVNGVAIRAGHRFRTTHDFGYVALDVLYTWGEDTGTYMCKATNLLGEAINTTTINVQCECSQRQLQYYGVFNGSLMKPVILNFK